MNSKPSTTFRRRGRTVLPALALVLLVSGGVLGSSFALAQTQPATGVSGTRNFPPKSLLGNLNIGVFPEATLNGQSARFSASGRLYNVNNMIVQPASVYNQSLVVRYELNFEGQINRAWLLNDAELKIAQDEAAARR